MFLNIDLTIMSFNHKSHILAPT